MLLKANKYRKDKKADCRQNELGSRIFVGRVFGDYAECLHFYPSFSYGRIIAGDSVFFFSCLSPPYRAKSSSAVTLMAIRDAAIAANRPITRFVLTGRLPTSLPV